LRHLIRRLRGGALREPGPTLDLVVETPPVAAPGNALWRFWLWLIDERRPTLQQPERSLAGGALWRLRVHLEPDPLTSNRRKR
jgi:hypothetical protein